MKNILTKRFVLTTMTAALMLAVSGVLPLLADEPVGRIQQRKENQQARIAQGVGSGSLTAGETANLEHKEANLDHEIRTDRKANGGNLTNNQKSRINRRQNRLSGDIYKDKHNAAHQSR
jgi:hypothetical protein